MGTNNKKLKPGDLPWIKQKTGRPQTAPFETPKSKLRLKTYIKEPLKVDTTLQTIYTEFMKPLITSLGVSENIQEYSDPYYRALEEVFNIPNRKIVEYVLRRNIKDMPGEYFIADGLSAPYGPTKIFNRGWRMLIVADRRRPDDIKIELFKNWEMDESYQYRLTKQELSQIMEYIEPVGRRRERLKLQKRESRDRLKQNKRKTTKFRKKRKK